MIQSIGNLYALVFGWPALSKLHRLLWYLSGRAVGLHNYTNERISGELQTLRIALSGTTSPTVFDVGANEGNWTAAVLAKCPGARIHAFEPQLKLANTVAARYPNVKVNNVGLADQPGRLELFDYATSQTGSQHASLLPGVIDGIHHGKVMQVSVAVDTLDRYCLANDIGRIDLLKIDVEGFELKVFEGAARMLAERRIGMIQFEFNEMNVVGRTFLKDFFACLDATHDMHRLLPHGLMKLRRDAHWDNEQFTFQNIFATPKS